MKLSYAAKLALIVVQAQKTAANLRGGARNLEDDAAPVQPVPEGDDYHADAANDCRVIVEESLMIPEGREGHLPAGHARRLEEGADTGFVCGFPDGSIATMDLTPTENANLRAAFVSGDVKSGVSRVDLGKAGASISGSTVSFPPGFNVAKNANKGPSQKSKNAAGGGSSNAANHRRELAQLVGNKYTLVVKGNFLDYPFTGKTAEQISDDVFGTINDPVNLKSQLAACSYDKLVTLPQPDPAWNGGALTSLAGIEAAPGTLEINMNVNMAGMTKSAIYNLFVSKTIEALGPAVTALPGPFDHVIFARQTCLTECGWAAYAGVNSWYQMFQGNYISYTGTQVHEMGHNLALGHSGSPGISYSGGTVGAGGYTDHTCQMGNPLYSDDIGKMCFNAAKSFQIDGWYNDAKLVLDPAGFNGAPDLPWTGDLVGVGEYDLRTNQPVTIKIETGTAQDVFVGFNRAAGPNAQNDLGDNLVTVTTVEGNNGEGYSQSQLLGLLDTSAYSELTVPGLVDYADLKIKVNSIDTSVIPGTAGLTIGFDQCASDAECQLNSGGCFASTCQAQGTADSNVLGCVEAPVPGCCGNDICEGGEDGTTCAADCIKTGVIQPEDCEFSAASCYIKDGHLFDVEAQADSDLTITDVEYKAYSSTGGNVRLYYREGGRAGYAAGTPLTSNGWILAKDVAGCGSWTMCSMGGLSIPVPRGTRVGILVSYYDSAGDIMYTNVNVGPVSDDHAIVHQSSAVNFNQAGEYVTSFSNNVMFNGKVIYEADITDPNANVCSIAADCDDGDYCNGAEQCTNNQCVSGIAPSCSGPFPFCSTTVGACVACLSDTNCLDSDLCNGAETCSATGTCQPGDALVCDNGDFCDGAETCDATTGCQASSNPCSGSTPFCNESTDSCVECATDSDCGDGDLCNGVEICSSGTCQAGTDVNCDDGIDCTVDFCTPSSGLCTNTEDNVRCVDTTNNKCSEDLGGCVACLSNGDCDNGQYCDGEETCNPSGQCVSGTAPACSGGSCSETLDQCVECEADVDCDDNVACTADTCSNNQCVHTPDDSVCDNTSFCAAETCDATGGCQASSNPCSGSTPFCNEVDNRCECQNDGDCGDNDQCNGVETCDATTGTCQPGDALVCDDGEFCNGAETCDATAGCLTSSNPCSGSTPFCNEVTDKCDECATDSDCGDGDLCNGIEICSSGTCQLGTTLNCDDGIFCNGVETCDATNGCQASTNPCSGSEFCNEANDSCDECASNSDCGDGVACTVDTCAGGTCSNAANDNNCNTAIGETCSASVGCTGGCQVGGTCGGNCSECCNGSSNSKGTKTCN